MDNKKSLKELTETIFGTYAFVDEESGVEITGFLNSQNTIDQYIPDQVETLAIPKGYGFDIIDTGGRCTAWHQEFLLDGKKVSMMITDVDGLSHKIEPIDRVLVGLYRIDDADGTQEAIKIWEQDNFPLDEDSNLPNFDSPNPEKIETPQV